MASNLNNLAVLSENKGKYAEAEPLYKRALAIREKSLGADHPDLSNALSNLANLLYRQGNYAEAEALHRRGIAIREKSDGPRSRSVADEMENLAACEWREKKKTTPLRACCNASRSSGN